MTLAQIMHLALRQLDEDPADVSDHDDLMRVYANEGYQIVMRDIYRPRYEMTLETDARGEAQIICKGKRRCAFLPTILCKMLKDYCYMQNIESGAVFTSRSGKALDRSNIWSEMKRLCKAAGVPEEKVYPHNLRHLFARTFYASAKDIVRLADILGHSSVNTTRIYTMESGDVHKRQIQRLGLVQN